MTQIKLAIGIPAYGGSVSAEHIKMWTELGFVLANSPQRFQLVSHGYVDINGIDNARNHLLKVATEARADWLLMIDADTWVEAYGQGEGEADAGFQLLRMISEADRAGAAIVVAPVARRKMADDGRREIMAYRRGRAPRIAGEELIAIDSSELLSGDTLIEIDAAATAVFAVRLSAVGFAKFQFTDTLSEDLEFCRQIKMAGGKVFVDRRVRTGHKSRPYAIYCKEF